MYVIVPHSGDKLCNLVYTSRDQFKWWLLCLVLCATVCVLTNECRRAQIKEHRKILLRNHEELRSGLKEFY